MDMVILAFVFLTLFEFLVSSGILEISEGNAIFYQQGADPVVLLFH